MGQLLLRLLRSFAPSLGLRHSACAALLALAGFLANPGSASALPWQPGDVLTYTQVSWPENATAAALLTDHYSSVYLSTSDVFEVGIPGPGGFSLSFGDASHVLAFLPQLGIPGPLTENQTNPGSSESGVFAGDVMALKLDVDFSDAGLLLGSSGIPFGDLVLNNFLAETSDADLDGLNRAAVSGGRQHRTGWRPQPETHRYHGLDYRRREYCFRRRHSDPVRAGSSRGPQHARF